MPHEKFNFVLQSTRMLSSRARQFNFRREDGAPFNYLPGQFVTLHMPWQDKELRRSYSIAASPGGDRDVEFIITYVEGGRGTGILFDMQPGARVSATGPFGKFTLRDEPVGRYLLVGTGTGIAPYRAMMPQLHTRMNGGGHEVVLLLGVRGPDELLYGEDIRRFARDNPAFKFIASYSRQLSEPPADYERKGYVQEHLMEINPDPKRDIVYLCGNAAMIDVAVEKLKATGFENHSLRREKYVSSN
jgi:ferredoxin-NADP reductase